MKKICYLLFTLVLLIPINVKAAAYTASTSKSKIEVGQTVTASVKVTSTAAWNVKITSSGATSGCSQSFVDVTSDAKNTTKTFTTVSCKATSVGIINFNFSGDITDANGTKVGISGNKSVTVTAVTPKSSNNDLSGLAITGYSLIPTFSKNTLEYSIELPNEVKNISITATKADNTATITGIGDYAVSEGLNTFEIKVTAQNGNIKTYVINATVKELDPIIVVIDGKEYNIVRKKESLEKPSSFEETDVRYGEDIVPGFYSEITKLTLFGLKDSEGNIALYIFDKETNTFTLYSEIIFKGINLLIKETDDYPSTYSKSSIKLGDKEVICYKQNDKSDFVLVYGVNVETGYEGFYVYDTKENTLQRYNEVAAKEETELVKKGNYYLIAAAIFGLGLLVSTVSLIDLNAKYKKIKKRKEIKTDVEKLVKGSNKY